MKVKYKMKPNQPLTLTQIEEIEKASKLPITYDEDCPKLTVEQLDLMRKIAAKQREERIKQTVSLRLDGESISLAKSFGKGYTGVMSRILYKALRDPEYIKDCL